MSTSRTYQCLSCRLKAAPWQAPGRRQFHSSTPRARRSIYPSIKATKLVEQETQHPSAPYTSREKELLAQRYTPEQLRIIELGEDVIGPDDVKAGRMRTDPARIKYLDDFATLRPVLDRPLEVSDMRQQNSEDGNERRGRRDSPPSANAEDADPRMQRLMLQTGLSKEEIRRLRIKNLVTHRVVNQTRMGKVQSLYFLTVAGNENGLVGIGEGKAAEDEDGRRQAMMNAIRNMKPIPRYEERTIYGDSEAKVAGTVVQLYSRPPGFGNRCQQLIFELARAAGITDLAARTPRSRNKMNVVKAAYQALVEQRLPEDVAKGRGRKMVDVRNVYYGGQVL